MAKQSVYKALVEMGADVDNHESDLYVKKTPEVDSLLQEYPDIRGTTFRSQSDGEIWYDLPFQYDPWWKARGCRA